MIIVRNLQKKFENKIIFNNINLHIKSGDIFGLLGKSGEGKSTFLRCLIGFETISDGEVILFGKNIHTIKHSKLIEIRQQISVIFQDHYLLQNKTVYENVEFPLKIRGISKKIRNYKIQEILEYTELMDCKNNYPCQISGGQRQRASIARAVITEPKLLFCDEPISSLDMHSAAKIIKLIKDIHVQYELTIFLISHQLNIINKLCNKVFNLTHGNISQIDKNLNLDSKYVY